MAVTNQIRFYEKQEEVDKILAKYKDKLYLFLVRSDGKDKEICNKMTVALVSNNRIARYVTTDEIIAGNGGALGQFIYADKLKLEEGEMRCIHYKTRSTRAGKKMASAIFVDADKRFHTAMVFGDLVDKSLLKCKASMICRPIFTDKEDGMLILQELN